MNSVQRVKKLKSVAVAVLASIFTVIAAITLASCDPDIKYNDAIAIAKKDFGVEKILWIGDRPLSKELPDEINRCHFNKGLL